MKTTERTPWLCSYCGYKMDLDTDPVGDKVPSEGAISICENCSGLHILHNNTWTPITEEEKRALPAEVKWKIQLIENAKRPLVQEALLRLRERH